MLHFSSPHCRDVIEIRPSPDEPVVGCIRIGKGQYRLFEVDGSRLTLLGLFGALGEAKNWAVTEWGRRGAAGHRAAAGPPGGSG